MSSGLQAPDQYELFMKMANKSQQLGKFLASGGDPSQYKFVDEGFRLRQFQAEVIRYSRNDLPKLPPGRQYPRRTSANETLESFLLRQPEFLQRLKDLGLDNIRSPQYCPSLSATDMLLPPFPDLCALQDRIASGQQMANKSQQLGKFFASGGDPSQYKFRIRQFQAELMRYARNDLPKLPPGRQYSKFFASGGDPSPYKFRIRQFQAELMRYARNDLPKLPPGRQYSRTSANETLESCLLRQPEFLQRPKDLGLDNIRSPPYSRLTNPSLCATVPPEEPNATLRTQLGELHLHDTPGSGGRLLESMYLKSF